MSGNGFGRHCHPPRPPRPARGGGGGYPEDRSSGDSNPPVTIHDAIVIGGGPAGSCAATCLAREGRKVLVLERARFPRFHIGESLLPYNTEIFEELGLGPKLANAGFPVKEGAQFQLGNGAKGTAFVFREGRFTRHASTYQVERSRFDEILLRHAEASGAGVREGLGVSGYRAESDLVVVRLDDGSEVRGRFLVDASGRGNLTGTQEGLKVVNPRLRKLAIFARFEGVRLDSGAKGGDTVIVRQASHWFWLIPLRIDPDGRGKVSAGIVMDRDQFNAAELPADEVFDRLVAESPPVRDRLGRATRISEVQVTSDFSYRNSRLWSPRCVRVGDAAGFIDPIFSSGVFLAMYSARAAARAVGTALAAGNDGSGEFAQYEQRLFSAMGIYEQMVSGFYTQPFMELFLEPRAKWGLAAAINAILAGELDGGWRLRWRLKLFFLLVRIQKRFPLVPRFSFAPAA